MRAANVMQIDRYYMFIALWLALVPKLLVADSRMDSLASVLRDITGQLERFNTMYINKLERELSLTSSRLSAMESTLRAVGDRALAWDNIQNHMTVWTDQTRTMEKKLDMLNRCHEKQASWETKLSAVDALNHKLTALDKKINAMTRLEFKVEKVSERVEEIDSKINYLKESTSSTPRHESPSLHQLAKRGLVSYLAAMDDKLDNISHQISHQRNLKKYHSPRIYGSRSRTTWQAEPPGISPIQDKEIKECFMSPHDSQLMEDVSAKVDLLFDRIIDPDYDYNVLVGNLKRQAPSLNDPLSHSSSHSDFDSTPEHIFAKFWKSLFSPFKKMNRRFRTFESQLSNVEQLCSNTSSSPEYQSTGLKKALDSRLDSLDEVLREEMAETRVAVSDQASHLKKLSQMIGNVGYQTKQLQSDVSRQFEAQRAVMQSSFQEIQVLVTQRCVRDSDSRFPRKDPADAPTTLRPMTPPVFPTYSSGSSSTIRSKRPAYTRSSGYVRSTRCLPKDSPLWHVPNLARTFPVCADGIRSNRQNDYRINYLGPQSSSSKRTYRKSSKNTVFRTFGRKSVTKRDLSFRGNIFQNNTLTSSENILEIDCSDYVIEGIEESRVFLLGNIREYNEANRDFKTRYCDQKTDGGGWTVIQRRGMFGRPYENFTRTWHQYKTGFGSLDREFWWGNDFIHRLSNQQDLVIRFDLWDFDGNYSFAEYSSFKIGPEEEKYVLSVSGYRGNASDSFSAHNGYFFSTVDRDNDAAPECCPCAPAYGGGWWFYGCFESNLNGEYFEDPHGNDYFRGLIWELWLGDYSLKATEIKVRPASFSPSIFPTPFPGPYPADPFIPELP